LKVQYILHICIVIATTHYLTVKEVEMRLSDINIQQLIYMAGLGQIALAAGSVVIPKLLNWSTEMNKVQPLIKQIFYTYACYILVFNFSFGLLSVFVNLDLTNGSRLATLVCGFIAVYWISRVCIQFFYFDRANFPSSAWHKLGESVLVTLFIFFSLVYSYAFYFNSIKL
jgi:hypothetical protein